MAETFINLHPDTDRAVDDAREGKLTTDQLLRLTNRLFALLQTTQQTNRELCRILAHLRAERGQLDRALSRNQTNLDHMAAHIRADRQERQLHDQYAADGHQTPARRGCLEPQYS